MIDKCKNISIKAQYPESSAEEAIVSNQSYPKGSVLKAIDIPCYNYQWYKISGSNVPIPVAGGYNSDIEITESNVTYKVVYSNKRHLVTINTDPSNNQYGSAEIVNPTQDNKYEACEPIELKATPHDSCYYFVKWVEKKGEQTKDITTTQTQGYTCSTTGGVNTLEVVVDTIATYTAHFERKQYTITANVQADTDGFEHGEAKVNGATSVTLDCASDLTATLTATPEACYYLKHWIKHVEGQADDTISASTPTNGVYTLEVPVSEDATYTAVFKKLKYKITAEVEEGQNTLGTVKSPTDSTDCDEHVTLIATATDCSEFVHWYRMDGENKVTFTPESYGDAISCQTNGKTDTLVVKADANEKYIAVFKQLKYKITAEVEDGQNTLGSVEYPTDLIECGENVTLTATATDCSEFVQWYRMDNGNKVTFTPESVGDAISCQTNGKTDTLVVKADANETYIAVLRN